MFNKLKSYINDIQISLDFHQYENQCRNDHLDQVNKLFSTKQIEDKKQEILNEIERLVNLNFGNTIMQKEMVKGVLISEANEIKVKLSYFSRNYKQELDQLYINKKELISEKSALYEKKNKLQAQLSEAFDNKEKAYHDVNYYKDEVESWYDKSQRTTWLFGNAGNKLPQYSLFGQSIGDLESSKYYRDSAYNDVTEAKKLIQKLKSDQQNLNNKIKQIKNNIDDVMGEIDQVKKDRSTMYELKDNGYIKRDLQSKLDQISIEINEVNLEINNLVSQKNDYLNIERHEKGIMDLDAQILEIKKQKNQFIDSFDLNENKQKRKLLHRENWLKNR
jgi:chromosome segregation ATPase